MMPPKHWNQVTFGDCVTLRSGGTPSKSNPAYWNGIIPWVSCKDMKVSRLHDSEDHVTDEGAANGTRLIPKGTILIVVRGMILAKDFPIAITQRTVAFNQDLKALEPKSNITSGFLFYWLLANTYEVKGIADEAAHGTKRLQTDRLLNLPVALPPLPTQTKIASILSAYDDLIENNTRRIAILEAMAQVIYREWFVEFRFPGHEKVKLVDSPLGKIPEGWKVVSLKQITTKIGSGATPRGGKEAYKTSGITLIRSLNIYDNQFEHDGLAHIDDDQAAQLDNVVVEKRDILLNITGASVARCCMVPSYLLPARVNQHVAIIRVNTKTCDPFYVLNTINSERHKRQILALAQGGATREALTKDTISNYEIVLPPSNIVSDYSEIITALFDQRELLQRKTNCLRTTRDLLLPKLISGHLDVENLDIEPVTMTE